MATKLAIKDGIHILKPININNIKYKKPLSKDNGFFMLGI